MTPAEMLALLHDLEGQAGFRGLSHVMQDRVRLAAHRLLRTPDPRARAFYDGFTAGVLAPGGVTDEEIWAQARKYIGATT